MTFDDVDYRFSVIAYLTGSQLLIAFYLRSHDTPNLL